MLTNQVIISIFKDHDVLRVQCKDEDNYYLIYGYAKANNFNISKGVGAFCLELRGLSLVSDDDFVTVEDVLNWILTKGGEILG